MQRERERVRDRERDREREREEGGRRRGSASLTWPSINRRRHSTAILIPCSEAYASAGFNQPLLHKRNKEAKKQRIKASTLQMKEEEEKEGENINTQLEKSKTN